MNLKFEVQKLEKQLKRSGINYNFKRYKKNAFGEPVRTIVDSELDVAGTLRAIYHESNGYIAVKSGDATKYRSKKTPMLLCLYKDASFLRKGDFVSINGKLFNMNGVLNVQEWSIIADVSLEVEDDEKVVQ